MDSDFTHLPQVVMEGRKVIHNVTRTAGVFFIKTIYSVLVSIFCVLTNTPFPFIPIQITLIDACIEAYPSFLTILESDTKMCIRDRAYSIVETPMPAKWSGKTLKELDVRRNYEVNVVGIKSGAHVEVNPDPLEVLRKDMVLILVGSNTALEAL